MRSSATLKCAACVCFLRKLAKGFGKNPLTLQNREKEIAYVTIGNQKNQKLNNQNSGADTAFQRS